MAFRMTFNALGALAYPTFYVRLTILRNMDEALNYWIPGKLVVG